jgi:hypothetical protein
LKQLTILSTRPAPPFPPNGEMVCYNDYNTLTIVLVKAECIISDALVEIKKKKGKRQKKLKKFDNLSTIIGMGPWAAGLAC